MIRPALLVLLATLLVAEEPAARFDSLVAAMSPEAASERGSTVSDDHLCRLVDHTFFTKHLLTAAYRVAVCQPLRTARIRGVPVPFRSE